LSLVYAVQPAQAAHHKGWRGVDSGGVKADARALRPSGRLSGRLRQHLPGGGAGDPRGPQKGRQAGQGCHLSDSAGWRRRRCLRGSLRQVVEEKRRLDEAVTYGHSGRPCKPAAASLLVQATDQPPSTMMFAPVMSDDAGEARKTTAPATSIG